MIHAFFPSRFETKMFCCFFNVLWEAFFNQMCFHTFFQQHERETKEQKFNNTMLTVEIKDLFIKWDFVRFSQ